MVLNLRDVLNCASSSLGPRGLQREPSKQPSRRRGFPQPGPARDSDFWKDKHGFRIIVYRPVAVQNEYIAACSNVPSHQSQISKNSLRQSSSSVHARRQLGLVHPHSCSVAM